MALKPSLVLKLGQQLKMTPQLQQAIRLLQLSSLELEIEIQQALDSNLMLEEVEGDAPDDAGTDEELAADADVLETSAEPIDDEAATSADESADAGDADPVDEPLEVIDPELDGDIVRDSHEELVADSVAEESPVDSDWDDIWDDPIVATGNSYNEEESDDFLDNRNFEESTLADHLLEQINLLHLSDADRLIAIAIIDSLDGDGVLTESIEEIWSGLVDSIDVELDEVEAVLHLVQHLDPVGVAARDLAECLSIQLRELPPTTPWRKQAIDLVANHLPLLGARDFAQLMRRTHLKEQELGEVIRLIQTLNPRPGSDFGSTRVDAVEPDVIVSKERGRWRVELNPRTAPRIRVNPEYASMVRRADNSSDNQYLRNHLQEARWFIKSLQQRNETLLKVASKIVEFQRGFFEYGEEAMKPLVLHDIADAVNLHESTISRVTTQKYMLTPLGLFELKYFFSSHVATHGGGEVSSTAIRALIKKLVSEENPRKPLSDNKIVSLLARQDIKVARRTIAKYREAMMIPPSNERKRLT